MSSICKAPMLYMHILPICDFSLIASTLQWLSLAAILMMSPNSLWCIYGCVGHAFTIAICLTNVSFSIPFGKWRSKYFPAIICYSLSLSNLHIILPYHIITILFGSFLWLPPNPCCCCVFDGACASCDCGSSSCPLLVLIWLSISVFSVTNLTGGIFRL